MKFRLALVALLGAALVSAGATHSAAQDEQKKAPVKTAPKKAAEKKEAPKKENAKPEQKKAEQKKTTPGTPALIAQYGDWGVYVNKTAKTCFALTQPKTREPANVKREPAYLFITTRPADKLKNEVSFLVGFPLKEEGDIVLRAAGTNFPMFAKGHGLWIKDTGEEPKLVEAFRKEDEIVLKLTPASGPVTTDSYSMIGVTQALERVAKECP